MVSISERACARVTPSASRPSTWKLRTLRFDGVSSGGSIETGSQISLLFGNFMSGAITPITDATTLFTLIDAGEDVRVAAVAALPDAVAEDDDRRGAGPVVLGAEVAADHRPLADQLEHVRRLIRALELLGRASFVADVDRRDEEQRQAGEGAAALAPVLEVEARDAGRPRARVEHADRDDPLGLV